MTHPAPLVTPRTAARPPRWSAVFRGSRTLQWLVPFLVVAGGHFGEHIVQVWQHLVLGWPAREAGGVLGLWFPGLAAAEVLHSTWNTLQLTGLILLWPLLRGRGAASRWWGVALLAQTWHWLEHVLLQVQVLTGQFLFAAPKQQSLLELLLPRIELHFLYNLLSFGPTAIAIVLVIAQERARARAR